MPNVFSKSFDAAAKVYPVIKEELKIIDGRLTTVSITVQTPQQAHQNDLPQDPCNQTRNLQRNQLHTGTKSSNT